MNQRKLQVKKMECALRQWTEKSMPKDWNPDDVARLWGVDKRMFKTLIEVGETTRAQWIENESRGAEREFNPPFASFTGGGGVWYPNASIETTLDDAIARLEEELRFEAESITTELSQVINTPRGSRVESLPKLHKHGYPGKSSRKLSNYKKKMNEEFGRFGFKDYRIPMVYQQAFTKPKKKTLWRKIKNLWPF